LKEIIILGNGFSIDFLKHIGMESKIDVTNLFKWGANVKWPGDDEIGFLSYKYCPYLWTLGARPTLDKQSTIDLIEEIITCANVYAYEESGDRKKNKQVNPYIGAYNELIEYLKYLFIYYNDCIPLIEDSVYEWSWAKLFKRLNDNTNIEEIIVITYNYDIWLERILIKLGIEFCFPSFTPPPTGCKVKIYKPHGSISFTYKTALPKDAYRIKYTNEFFDGAVSDFNIQYDSLENNYIITALIPPAGDSTRFNHSWSNKIRTDIKTIITNTSGEDEVMICGISYWHVDRAELDELFTSLNIDINIKVINPSIDRTLNAVIVSLFKNYILYENSKVLEG